MVRAELLLALQLCPKVAEMVPPHVLDNPSSATPSDVARWAVQAVHLLPESRRNNDQTFYWAFERHGVRALTMLAIVLSDPNIENPCSYFGWMAKQDPSGAPDLRFNLARLARSLEQSQLPAGPPEISRGPRHPARIAPGLEAPEGTDDPVWASLAGAIRRRVREGAYGSWFARIGFHGITDRVLMLSSPSETVVTKIRTDFVPVIIDAAADVGVEINRVVVVVRKAGAS